jgi:diguanylate cyclase (GGDEF)-like protein
LKNLSTRIRIIALIILVALPALGLTVINAMRERATADARARQEITQLAQIAAAYQDRIIESSHQMLIAISPILPELQLDRERCNRYFANMMKSSGDRYHSMGIHSADGTQFCNGIETSASGNINVNDRRYFRLAMQTRAFAIGDFQIGRVTGKPGINFGYPALGSDGEISGVAFLALDLHTFNAEFANLTVPPYARLAVFDRNGIVLARSGEGRTGMGEKLSVPTVLEHVLSGDRGVFEATGTDGQQRLFAYQEVAKNPDGSVPLSVLISIPKSVIYAEAHAALVRSLLEILLVTLLLIAGAWYGTEKLVLRDIRTLLRTAERIRGGDLGARTGMHVSRDELKQIGHAFDEMAQSLQDRDTRLAHALQELREQASTDALTGLYNRRHFREVLQRELTRAKRHGSNIALVMVDLDYFKKVNDTHGHGAGDLVLREIGALLKENLRAGDTACRFGGEEFALILPESGSEGARLKAETLRQAVSELDLAYDGRELGRLTASFGIALFPDHADDPDALLRAADEALYAAKGAGRNRVLIQEAPARLHAVDTAARSAGKIS